MATEIKSAMNSWRYDFYEDNDLHHVAVMIKAMYRMLLGKEAQQELSEDERWLKDGLIICLECLEKKE